MKKILAVVAVLALGGVSQAECPLEFQAVQSFQLVTPFQPVVQVVPFAVQPVQTFQVAPVVQSFAVAPVFVRQRIVLQNVVQVQQVQAVQVIRQRVIVRHPLIRFPLFRRGF